MAKIKTIRDCKTGADIIKLAKLKQKKGENIEVIMGGKHPKIRVPGRGTLACPNREIGKGLMCAIVRQWKALGLAIVILALILGVSP